MSSPWADPVTMDPREFARHVRAMSTDELETLMRGPRRRHVLDELLRRMPSALRRDRAKSIDAVVHWQIGDRPDGGTDRYQMVIAKGECELSSACDRAPALTLTLSGADFVRLVTGNVHAVMLVMKGRLATKGDLRLTAKFPNLFDIPKP
ncbi:SCP2 sterol-binding domain-containing protein [Salinispora arenicola]|uniref:SCP-2 sterol transfer family protein n=1 Tax=Salinispora arenicola TaxID=168697 RepID=A0A542XIK6_SALAC|nr:SCP2 sterol-binding domain-containing protein [Salinispora arenicola]MCN0150588.1 SCP2 sterol-binding domain-containing protein [Salinispora arenicola]NIL42171.1 SCP2 sterol-binding domain-containing protein [Salinispora arenicola]TQL35646.1 SCP-2 sterol transfer family protein [Salinispora arenicola]GIM81748.1 hypothetical protein Sar04_03720 [Salinispora arenicola]